MIATTPSTGSNSPGNMIGVTQAPPGGKYAPQLENPFTLPMQAFVASNRLHPLAASFLHPSNVEYICTQISKVLSIVTGQGVIQPCNTEIAIALSEMMVENAGMAYTPSFLGRLNAFFIEKESRLQLVSLNNRYRFFKWFIEGDRPRFAPYPINPDGPGKEVKVSISEYLLRGPQRRFQPALLQNTYCIGTSFALAGQSCL